MKINMDCISSILYYLETKLEFGKIFTGEEIANTLKIEYTKIEVLYSLSKAYEARLIKINNPTNRMVSLWEISDITIIGHKYLKNPEKINISSLY